MNSTTAAANVGMNHLRSLGLSAGRKNASSCHRITGEQATMAAQMEILKRVENASNGSMAMNDGRPSGPFGRYSAIGIIRNWPMVGVAK